jgi:1-acyl-sn-glycerol-3-phosphate acyltransferase
MTPPDDATGFCGTALEEVARPPRGAARLAPIMLRLWLPFALATLALHIGWGLLCAALVLPWLGRGKRDWLIRLWSRMLLAIVGARLEVRGSFGPARAAACGRLLVANHVSWLDVYAIDALQPSRFIAKAEITRWPVVGWLVSLVGTLYVERGRRHAVAGINRSVAAHLALGETIAIFPEGTTSDGASLLRFHANLIQPALDRGAAIQPLAIRYTQDHRFSRAAAYIGDMTLFDSLLQIMLAPRLTVTIEWLPPIPLALGNRHALARAARTAIAGALGIADLPDH